MIEIENQLPSLGVLWKYSLIVVLAVFTYVIIGSRLLVSLISKFAGEEEVNKPLAIATIECRSLRFISVGSILILGFATFFFFSNQAFFADIMLQKGVFYMFSLWFPTGVVCIASVVRFILQMKKVKNLRKTS